MAITIDKDGFPAGRAAEGIAKLRETMLDLSLYNPLISIDSGERRGRILRLGTVAMEGYLAKLLSGKPVKESELGGGINLARLAEANEQDPKAPPSDGLYFTYGWLSWSESGLRQGQTVAPLFLLPVDVEEEGGERVLVSRSGVLSLNHMLSQKLDRDFSIRFPRFIHGEETPEEWMQKFAPMIADQEHWSLRSGGLLGHFAPSRFIIWQDLDEEKWPKKRGLDARPLIARLWESEPSRGRAAEPMPKNSQTIAAQIKTPLAELSPANEMVVLADVLEGNSLALIAEIGDKRTRLAANIMGAALAEGKTLLYVSENRHVLRALRHELARLKLEPFCLDMATGQTLGGPILEQLRTRLSIAGKQRMPKGLEREQEKLDKMEADLGDYASEIAAPAGQMGIPVADLFAMATWYRAQLGSYKDLLKDLPEPDAHLMTESALLDRDRIIDDWSGGIAEFADHEGGLETHPWFGVGVADLSESERQDALDRVADWRRATIDLKMAIDGFSDNTGLKHPGGIADVVNMPHRLAATTRLPSAEIDWSLLARLRSKEKLMVLETALKQIKKYQDARRAAELAQQSRQEGAVDLEKLSPKELDDMESTLKSLQKLGIALDKDSSPPKLGQLRKLEENIKFLATQFKVVRHTVKDVGKIYGLDLPHDMCGLIAAADLVELTLNYPTRHRANRQAIFDNDALVDMCEPIRVKAEELKAERKKIMRKFNPGGASGLAELERSIEVLSADRGASWLDKDLRAARTIYKEVKKGKHSEDPVEMAEELLELAEFTRKSEAFNEDPEAKKVLGDLFFGVNTDFDGLIEMRKWYEEVMIRFTDMGADEPLFIKTLLGVNEVLETKLKRLDPAPEDFMEIFSFCREALDEIRETCPALIKDLKQKELNWVEELQDDLGKAIGKMLDQAKSCGLQEDLDLAGLMSSIAFARAAVAELDAEMPDLNIGEEALALMGPDYEPEKMNPDDLQPTLEAADDLHHAFLPDGVADHILTMGKQERYDKFAEALISIDEGYETWARAQDAAGRMLELDVTRWGGGRIEAINMDALVKRLDRALAASDGLVGWLTYLRAGKEVKESGLSPYIELVEAQKLPIDMLKMLQRAAIYRSLSRHVLAQSAVLRSFNGRNYRKMIAAYRDQCDQLSELNRDAIRARTDYAAQTNNVENIKAGRENLDKWANDPHARVTEFEIMHSAGAAVQVLCPIFIMGPDQVAQFLSPGRLSFDLVIIDEAQELRLHSGLGALARAEQAIIMGQERARADDDVDEDTPSIDMLTAGKRLAERCRALPRELPDKVDQVRESYLARSMATAFERVGFACDLGVTVMGQVLDLGLRPAPPEGEDGAEAPVAQISTDYIAGIQGDNLDYRYAGTVLEREYLRPKALESAGWHVSHIYAPDWLRAPAKEVERVLTELKATEGGSEG